jgi:hypothetical protein
MKKFFLKLLFVALLAVIGFLGWRSFESRQKIRELRETVAHLEKERREALAQRASAQRAPKPEQQAEQRRQIELETSRLRELPFKKPVNYKMIARDELRAFIVNKTKEQYTDKELHDYGRTLAAFGLVPEGTDLLDVLVSMYDEQVGAFYVPEERMLYTFKDLSWSSSLDKMLLAHELTHALQDQNFDLTTFPLKLKNDDDRVLATAALIEGDATVLMTQFYVETVDPRNMLGDFTAMLGQNTAKLQAAPRYLREMLLFPYQQGQQFVSALVAAGGMHAVDDAFRHPPTSSQQILHPERFLHDRREPTAVDVPPLPPSDWALIGDNVLGEFGTRSVLQEGLSFIQAQLAAQGWAGDRYHVYERGTNGPTGLIWRTVWDSEPNAEQFEEAYGDLMKKRDPPSAARATVRRRGKSVTILQSADAGFLKFAEAIHAQ